MASTSPAWVKPGATCAASIAIACGDTEGRSEHDAAGNAWPPLFRDLASGLAIYARVDGGFTVWDPLRNVGPLASGYGFTQEALWNGLAVRGVDVCNGLIADVHDWCTRRSAEHGMLQDVLTELSPPGESMELGDPIQLPAPDERWYPTLRMSYGSVPVVHASAAVKRVLSFTYLLVWTFDDERDSLFHFEIARGVVTARFIPWTTHGDATNWLESNVFGLPYARSPEAEGAIDAEPNTAVPEWIREAAQKKKTLPELFERVKTEASKLP